jgi:ribosome maturation factor RimP
MEASQQVAERVRAIAAPIVTALGLELVEVACLGQGSKTLIRVCIDRSGGVQLADCEQVHQSLGHALDVEDPIPHAYTLEVSSPGLDRPFRSREDYQKAIQKKVRIKLARPRNGEWRLRGRLVEVEETGIALLVREGRKGKKEMIVRVPWEDLAEAQREIEF